MNKAVSPKQLELTAGKSREELLIQALPSHIDPESPAFKSDLAKVDKIEKEEAARAVLGLGDKIAASKAPVSEIVSGPVMGSGFAFGAGKCDDFDWDNPDEEAILLREQRATAAYRNKAGELIIRQRASWDEEHDTFVFISPENEIAFMEGLAKRAKEG